MFGGARCGATLPVHVGARQRAMMPWVTRRPERVAERSIRVAPASRPAVVCVPAATPVRLTFRRGDVRADCEALVFPELGRLVTLPTDRDVTIAFDALEPGDYAFSCCCGTCCSGRLIVGGGR